MRGRLLSGRYRLLEPVGAGGMGQVWRARDENLGRLVAAKLFAPPEDVGAGERQELLRRFRREARAVAALSSPYVVTVHDHGTDDAGGGDVPYLVMELISGESVQEILRREVRVPVERALEWARQTALGLSAAHAAGIVHRDIKPANLMVVPGDPGAVKILDFGIAAYLEGAEAATRLTRTGMLPIGSVQYMAPERFRQEPGDGRIDLYALGCVLYELLVGRPPFVGPAAGVMYNHLHDTPLRPSRARPEVPRAVDELVLSLMAKEAGSRPGDAGVVVGVLEGALEGALRGGASGGGGSGGASPTAATGAVPVAPRTRKLAQVAVPAAAPGSGAGARPGVGGARWRGAWGRRRAVVLGAVALLCAGAGVAVPVAIDGGGPGPRAAVGPLEQPTFRIAVTGRGDAVDTKAVRRALDDYAGLLPLDVVAVPRATAMSSREFARRYPDVVALVGPAAATPGFMKGTPGFSTCQSGPVTGSRGRFPAGSDAVLGTQFAAHLDTVLRTKRLLVTKGAAPQVPRDLFDAGRDASRHYATAPAPPHAMTADELRALLADARPDTVYLADEAGQQRNVQALRAAGHRGRIVLAPDRRTDCDPAGNPRERQVTDGVLRFRTVSDGPPRTGECTQEAAWCARVRPLMTRPGALEEYEATQAVVAAFRARAVNDTDPAEVRGHLTAALPGVRIHGLQGDHTLTSPATTAHPVWVQRSTGGTWTTLGTVASLTRG
ncbi:serine/threonine-protein kinase [Streptomyces sp. BYX5S]